MCVFYTHECVYTCVYSLPSPLLVEAKVQPPSSSSIPLHLLVRRASLSELGVRCFSCPHCLFSPDIGLRLIPNTGGRRTFWPNFYMDIGHLKSCFGVCTETLRPLNHLIHLSYSLRILKVTLFINTNDISQSPWVYPIMANRGYRASVHTPQSPLALGILTLFMKCMEVSQHRIYFPNFNFSYWETLINHPLSLPPFGLSQVVYSLPVVALNKFKRQKKRMYKIFYLLGLHCLFSLLLNILRT